VSPRTALITGVTGQDGGYLAEQLVADGTSVHGLVRRGEAIADHLTALGAGCTLHAVDIADSDALTEVVEKVAPDEVYNLVGLSSVVQSWQEPVLAAELNGVTVARLLEILWSLQKRTGRQPRLIQASSAEIFAGAASAPQDEGTPLSPRSPYGASKAFAHQLVQVFRQRGMHATNAILYNHESPRRPPTFVTRKITSTVVAIAQGTANELVLGNLDARRDWGWAPEYVDALVRAVRHDVPDDYVVATGVTRKVSDFVAAAFARVGITDWQGYVRVDPAFVRPSDAVALVGRADRAYEVLGWVPQVDFAELVGRMVDADVTGGTAAAGPFGIS
jgi:GDPmannose 4,6-dehydratase